MGNKANRFTRKTGSTTYIVSLKQSETARKTPDEKICHPIAGEVMAEGFAESDCPRSRINRTARL